MKRAMDSFLEYLRSVRNSSPHTVTNYGKDLSQFLEYMSPPGAEIPGLGQVTHQMIREFVGHLHEEGLAKSSIAQEIGGAAVVF